MYQFLPLLAAIPVILAGVASPAKSRLRDFTVDEIANGLAQNAIAAQVYQNAWDALPEEGECSKQNVQIRKEFRAMSLDERKAFSDALQCLQNTPSELDSSIYPGAKSKYDDFVVAHVNMTGIIHASAPFLPWHRYYIWVLRQALVEYCDYQGQVPFWEWGFDAASDKPLRESELFNGDEYSMGSDGIFLPNNTDKLFNLSAVLGKEEGALTVFPAGSGGGKIFSGPFSNYTVNLGPVANPYLPPLDNPFGYNPRPLTRSLRQETLQKYVSYSVYTPFVINATTPFDFQTRLDHDDHNPAIPPIKILWGPHGTGHLVMGGPVGDDLGISPSEPMFWLHHAQIDRLYWIWQNLDPSQVEYRTSNIANLTVTTYNNPPSRLGTVDDMVDLNFLAPLLPIRDTMKTTTGSPFCYIYQ